MLVMTVHLIDLRSDDLRCFNSYVLLICFILFVYFYLIMCYFLIIVLLWNSRDQKGKLSFCALFMNNKVFLFVCLICMDLHI